MRRWPALFRDPVFLFLAAITAILGLQALSWSLHPMSGILAGGFLCAGSLMVQRNRPSPLRWTGILLCLAILLVSAAQTTSLLVLSLAGAIGLMLAAALPPSQKSSECEVQQPLKPAIAPPDEILAAFGNDMPFDDLNDEIDEEMDHEQSGDLLQHWERRRLPSGEEIVETTIKLMFAAHEQVQTLHLPLHPPLVAIERVHCEIVDGADVICEVDAIRAFGVRIAARRRGAYQQPLHTYVWIAISASSVSTKAA